MTNSCAHYYFCNRAGGAPQGSKTTAAGEVGGLLKGWKSVVAGFGVPCIVEVALHIGSAEFV